jgi:cell division protein FtsB
VLLGVVLAYVGPATSYLRTWGEAKHQRHEVARLQHEHQRLAARQASLRDPRTLEQEARRLGMVRPDERSYVILGLPDER